MACTLEARGKKFDVESFLSKTRLPFKHAHFWIRGTLAMRRKPTRYQDSGFSEWVSRDRWDNLRAAIADVLKFLQANKRELGKLGRTPGIEHMMLDFGYNCHLGTKKVAVQGEYLPPELLRLAGELNIGIGLSLYPPDLEAVARKLEAVSLKKKRLRSR